MSKNKILFVCMGNICRSPSAEALFNALLHKTKRADGFEVDSAGTHGYHVGQSPDKRSVAAASRRGIDMRQLRARQVKAADFVRYDRIIVMDQANHQELINNFPQADHSKISYMLDYGKGLDVKEVPDPYYGEGDGFERVLDLLEVAAQGLLDDFAKGH